MTLTPRSCQAGALPVLRRGASTLCVPLAALYIAAPSWRQGRQQLTRSLGMPSSHGVCGACDGPALPSERAGEASAPHGGHLH